MCLRVVPATLRQNVKADADEADRIAATCSAHRGILERGRIHYSDRPRSKHFEFVIRTQKKRSILIESNPRRKRIVRNGGQQSPEAVALTKMLIDYETIC